jgi:hypothetical protein
VVNHSWLVVSTPLKNMKVSWDYEIPNIWKNKINVPTTNQINYRDHMVHLLDLFNQQTLI